MPTTRQRAAHRHAELKAMLEHHRQELVVEVSGKIRDVRARSTAKREGAGEDNSLEFDPQSDIDLALIQMKSDTLRRIEAALRRLAEKVYGNCAECGRPISGERLRALPFAVRCTGCEEAREMTTRRQSSDQHRAYGDSHPETPA